jgi:nitroimidazol reductase NimA-like FMN-containing flavoprotein (pyridoxamine 5'-phosphate oxidase superfamily)
MRRKDKEITERADIEAIIRAAAVCRLAMVEGDRPYLVPLCFGYRDNALYFHSADTGRKLDALRKNPRVCFEMDVDAVPLPKAVACEWGMRYRSVIGFGTAVFLESESAKRAALDVILGHYGGRPDDYSASGLNRIVVIRVDIEQMTGKTSG